MLALIKKTACEDGAFRTLFNGTFSLGIDETLGSLFLVVTFVDAPPFLTSAKADVTLSRLEVVSLFVRPDKCADGFERAG